MPKWGIEMTEGTITEWALAEGAAFARGTTICVIESDKVTTEVEGEFDSVLKRIVVGAGETARVGALIGVFADADVSAEEIEAFVQRFEPADTSVAADAVANPGAPPSGDRDAVAKSNAAALASLRASPAAIAVADARSVDLRKVVGSGRHGRVTHQDVHQASLPEAQPRLVGPIEVIVEEEDQTNATPLARRAAMQHNVDLRTIVGTGKRGRVRMADVLTRSGPRALAPKAGNEPIIAPMDRTRKVIARRMALAKSTIPHFYLRTRACIDGLVALLKAGRFGEQASLNDCLLKAAADTLVLHPELNVQLNGEDIHTFPHADVAFAVAAGAGLVSPIVRMADTMSVDDIARATSALVAKARAGKLARDDIEGGTFTLSNLGMYGIEEFDAIINPPQAAILAVGAATPAWSEDEGGKGKFKTLIALSLSCDHRVIDGATGAKFLSSLKALIETPEKLAALS
jgi:pyruvate dehydrogenase E2 component (dihydrolipoamide acetyltransferase)